jgi:predicted TIM-barrel fold metal-dependent hydrolase
MAAMRLGRVIDVCAYDVPMARKLPGLTRILGDAPADAGEAGGPSEAEGLTALIAAMDRAGVLSSLVVLQEEVADFLRLAAEHPGRLSGLAHFDLLQPRDSLERVRALCEAHPTWIAGIHAVVPTDGPDPRDRALAPLYGYCLARALPIQFRVGGGSDSGQDARIMALAVLASCYPALQVICLGGSPQAERLRVLHTPPNLFFEAGGVTQGIGKDGAAQDPSDLRGGVGSRRLLFGSGWPVGRAAYPARVAALRRFPWWQRQHVAWRTAARIYGPRILEGRPTPKAIHS